MRNYFKYNKYLLKNNYSEKTINLYLYYLNRFYEWYESVLNAPFILLTKDIVKLYIDFLSPTLKSPSINSLLNFFKSYNNFLVATGIQNDMADLQAMRINLPKVKNTSKIQITESYLRELLQKVYDKDGIKNYTILFLISYSGLRAEEVTDLMPCDIDFVSRTINVRAATSRKIPMDSMVSNTLKFYFKEVESDQEYLFLNEKFSKYTERGIQWIFRKSCTDKGITLKALRDFYKTKLHSQGYSDKEIDKVLGLTTSGKSYISEDLKNMCTPKKASEVFGVTPLTIIKWCDKGILRAFKTEKGFRKIPFSEIERLKSEKANKAKLSAHNI